MPSHPVSENKYNQLLLLLDTLGISLSDIEKKYMTGSGKGGQKQNRSNTCVQLHHIPTKTIIKCQASRSKTVNEYKALKQLADHIAHQQGIQTKASKAKEKIKKQKKRRKRRSQQGDIS